MPPPHHGTCSELRLLHELIDSFDGSPASQADVEEGLESGLARLMLLQGQLRHQASRAGGTRRSDQPRDDHDLVDEIRSLREAVSELRTRAIPGKSASLAQGFVLRRKA